MAKNVEQHEVNGSPKKGAGNEEFLTMVGSTGGAAMLGAAMGGPVGAIVGAGIGFFLGRMTNENRRDKENRHNS
ncbi:MAG: hypothetical protein OXF42_03630 [Candidatus Dadabacteria bacterium]|nr:hypothetical protein [Candidatus Dadabacteria bacterium]